MLLDSKYMIVFVYILKFRMKNTVSIFPFSFRIYCNVILTPRKLRGGTFASIYKSAKEVRKAPRHSRSS